MEYFTSPSKQRNKKTIADLSDEFTKNKKNWCNFCSELYPIKKKPKYIEVKYNSVVTIVMEIGMVSTVDRVALGR